MAVPSHVTLNHCLHGVAPRRPSATSGAPADPALKVIAVTTRFDDGRDTKFATNVFYTPQRAGGGMVAAPVLEGGGGGGGGGGAAARSAPR